MRVDLTVPVGEQVERLEDRQLGETRAKWRGAGERDRDRILYSSAFQRLGGVTQVTAPEPGHAFHTRLTHSLKVAQVARACARMLKQQNLTGTAAQLVAVLDPEAVEASALAHDLGHPPFGHIAEERLDANAREAGGFEGNAQSFRILTRLAVQARNPRGLNLTRQTLNGVLKYPWARSTAQRKKWGVYDDDLASFDWVREDSATNEPSLGARLMDWADDLTYAVHDVDDFYRAGLIPLDRLAAGGTEVERFHSRLIETQQAGTESDADALVEALGDALSLFKINEAYSGAADQRIALRSFGSLLIGHYVDAVEVRDPNIPGKAVLVIDEKLVRQVRALKAATWLYVVRRPSLAVIQHGQRQMIDRLFEWYYDATGQDGDARLLPPAYQERLSSGASSSDRMRLVADLIASLSEQAAVELHRRLGGTGSGSAMDATARVH
jgi:dGTPase